MTSEIEWQALNPARGEKGPRAGALWGSLRTEVSTGFLARFSDGFSSPPHIHNETYRAVVISGLIHNDDPDAAKMWMPPGSFWTQPKGENHITAVKKGTNGIALVEIDKGPYVVRPSEEAFDEGEKPINIVPSNIVWLDLPDENTARNGAKIAYLIGSLKEGYLNSTFIKLPMGFMGELHSNASVFHAVVISGLLNYSDIESRLLEPGSYFGSEGKKIHKFASDNTETIIYVRTNSKYEIISQ
ncbi:MAG: DUF4437 domain-containing protein [Gammaproteobacteria bacterium]